MKGRRYKVSLVGFEEPAPPAGAQPRRSGRRLHRTWSRFRALSWQLQAALCCVFAGVVILISALV